MPTQRLDPLKLNQLTVPGGSVPAPSLSPERVFKGVTDRVNLETANLPALRDAPTVNTNFVRPNTRVAEQITSLGRTLAINAIERGDEVSKLNFLTAKNEWYQKTVTDPETGLAQYKGMDALKARGAMTASRDKFYTEALASAPNDRVKRFIVNYKSKESDRIFNNTIDRYANQQVKIASANALGTAIDTTERAITASPESFIDQIPSLEAMYRNQALDAGAADVDKTVENKMSKAYARIIPNIIKNKLATGEFEEAATFFAQHGDKLTENFGLKAAITKGLEEKDVSRSAGAIFSQVTDGLPPRTNPDLAQVVNLAQQLSGGNIEKQGNIVSAVMQKVTFRNTAQRMKDENSFNAVVGLMTKMRQTGGVDAGTVQRTEEYVNLSPGDQARVDRAFKSDRSEAQNSALAQSVRATNKINWKLKTAGRSPTREEVEKMWEEVDGKILDKSVPEGYMNRMADARIDIKQNHEFDSLSSKINPVAITKGITREVEIARGKNQISEGHYKVLRTKIRDIKTDFKGIESARVGMDLRQKLYTYADGGEVTKQADEAFGLGTLAKTEYKKVINATSIESSTEIKRAFATIKIIAGGFEDKLEKNTFINDESDNLVNALIANPKLDIQDYLEKLNEERNATFWDTLWNSTLGSGAQ